MWLKTLKLNNFRVFENVALELSEGVNLLVGTNGAGKTSLLEAITIIQAVFFREDKSLNIKKYIDIEDVRIGRDDNKALSAFIEAEIKIDDENTINVKREATVQITTNSTSNLSAETKKFAQYGKMIFEQFDTTKKLESYNPPLLAYYSSQRLHKSGNAAKRQSFDSGYKERNGYLLCLDEKSIYPVLHDWLGDTVTNRANKPLGEIDDQDVVLSNIEAALALLFLKITETNSSIRIWQKKEQREFHTMLKIDDNPSVPLSRYSDGWRNLIYLIVDMVWRASQLRPYLTFEKLQKQTKGIVLIDELDLHIHVKWQMALSGVLQDLFPNVQFIVTTHSPSLVAGFTRRLDPKSNHVELKYLDNIYNVSNLGIEAFNNFNGQSVLAVIIDILGGSIRTKATNKLIAKIRTILDNPETKSEEKQQLIKPLLDELARQVSVYDPDYVSLEMETILLN